MGCLGGGGGRHLSHTRIRRYPEACLSAQNIRSATPASAPGQRPGPAFLVSAPVSCPLGPCPPHFPSQCRRTAPLPNRTAVCASIAGLADDVVELAGLAGIVMLTRAAESIVFLVTQTSTPTPTPRSRLRLRLRTDSDLTNES